MVHLIKIHHFFHSTDMTTNETFIFRESMKKEDRLSFVDAMEKEIHDNEEGVHWTVLHLSTIPKKTSLYKINLIIQQER